jgi:UDP-N-acetylmuramate--alanine ligase
VIVCRDTARYEDVVTDLTSRVVTYGEHPDADYRAGDVSYDEMGRGSYTLLEKGTPLVRVSLSIPGTHNVLNSLAAFAAGRVCGLEPDVIAAGLAAFKGTGRRFEYKGRLGDITIIDDYAHHPTEIRTTLAAAQNYPHEKIWCVFQPHTYTRTKALMDEFASALSLADHVILADIYAAREKDNLGISSKTLCDRILSLGHECNYFPTLSGFGEIEKFLLQNCTKGDLLITMGAGDVVKIGDELLGR